MTENTALIPLAKIKNSKSLKPLRAQRALLGTVLCAVVLCVQFFCGSIAAFAHDTLESTNPADGSTISAMPENIVLNFNENPAAIGSKIQVMDMKGNNWGSGDVKVVDRTVTQALKEGAPAGKYTINWRVVSSDSHPIEGTFSFVIAGATSVSPGASEPATSAKASPAQPAQAEQFPWGTVILVLVLTLFVLVTAVIVKKNLKA